MLNVNANSLVRPLPLPTSVARPQKLERSHEQDDSFATMVAHVSDAVDDPKLKEAFLKNARRVSEAGVPGTAAVALAQTVSQTLDSNPGASADAAGLAVSMSLEEMRVGYPGYSENIATTASETLRSAWDCQLPLDVSDKFFRNTLDGIAHQEGWIFA